MVKTRQNSFAKLVNKNMNTIMSKFGRSDITLVTYSDTYNANGRLASHTATTTNNITGDLQFVTYQDGELLSTGYVTVGDGIFYTVHDRDLSEDDEITVDSVKWKLVKKIESETLGSSKIYQAWVCVRMPT